MSNASKLAVVGGQLGSTPDPLRSLLSYHAPHIPSNREGISAIGARIVSGKNILVGQLPGLHFDPSYATAAALYFDLILCYKIVHDSSAVLFSDFSLSQIIRIYEVTHFEFLSQLPRNNQGVFVVKISGG